MNKIGMLFFGLLLFADGAAEAAVKVTEWHESFSAYGVQTTTQSTTLDAGGFIREEWKIVDPTHFIATTNTKITRPDLHKVWIINLDKKKYIEFELQPSTSDSISVASQTVSVASLKEPALPDSFDGITVSSQVIGPGPVEDIQGIAARPYTIALTVSAMDPKSGVEIRRYEYHSKTWLSDKIELQPFRVDWNRERIVLEYQVKSAISNLQDNTHKNWLTKDLFATFRYEQTILALEQVRILQQLPGVPVRQMTTSSSQVPGKEQSFKDQETAVAMQGGSGVVGVGNPLELGVSLGANLLVSGLRRLGVQHREIPNWVLEVDPDFARHGGSAAIEEFRSLDTVPSSDLFELPQGVKLKKVKHF